MMQKRKGEKRTPAVNRVAKVQEIVRVKNLQGQGKVREFYFESGKIDIANNLTWLF